MHTICGNQRDDKQSETSEHDISVNHITVRFVLKISTQTHETHSDNEKRNGKVKNGSWMLLPIE